MKKIVGLLLIGILACFLAGCSKNDNKNTVKKNNNLIVFHAGSLSVPLAQMKKAFEKKYPGTNIILEAAGSRMCARKIADLKQKCDVMMSADYSVINQILIPKYASWCLKFANNQMAIVYTKKSKYANEINSSNWYKILQRKGVVCGHSNPNDDPCGYRALLTMKLASIYYHDNGLFQKINDKKGGMVVMRPKETDLLSLLEVGQIDYIFLYKSVAEQHNLEYVELPPQVNMSSLKYANYYKQVKVEVSGKTPGSKITKYGAPMLYGLTIPKNAPNPKLAMKFVEFVMNKNEGGKIMEENGQKSVVPAKTSTYNELPQALKKYAVK
ncbi:MAG: tungstate ABC transporter substrate-binding protein WtpA [bacterium]|nr:tungstate ABC transporter substrate-binding protein WtpA [bacterium]